MSETYKKCTKCGKDMNVIDDHADCFRHRNCTEDSTCEVCRAWTPGSWASYNKMVDKAMAKSASKSNISSDKGNTTSSSPPSDSVSDVSRSRAPPSVRILAENVQTDQSNLSNFPSQFLPPSRQDSFRFPPPSGQVPSQFMGFQNPFFMSQEAFNQFIDGRIQHMFKDQTARPMLSSTVTSAESRSLAESHSADNSSVNQRFDRFINESRSDVLELDTGGHRMDDHL